MFGCTPVKKEDDDDELKDVHWSNVLQDNPSDDSEGRQTVKENRDTHQTPAFDARKGKGRYTYEVHKKLVFLTPLLPLS